ncbi:hypothetical protein GCM10023185_13100 [Hymenobacter saemangeumensis]|uniref:Uncharacterized protein n=1 Tax=Hymenobacter saemangeumensis TaxID=1084522 RepID=A0ABP8I7F3_9BACT
MSQAKSYLHLSVPFFVGFRRNNPGNLAKSSRNFPGIVAKPDTGRGNKFFAFASVAHGFRALIEVLMVRISTPRTNTIRKLGPVYAPPHENDTAAWVKTVAKYAGMNPDTPLTVDKQVIKRLALAIIKKETGLKQKHGNTVATFSEEDFEDGWALLQAPPLA